MMRNFRQRVGLTLTEIVISTAIVGGIGIVTLKGMAAMNESQLGAVDYARSQLLARELMDEVLAQEFGTDPINDVDGAAATSRASFDTIDDYHNWNVAGDLQPQLKNGTPIEHADGWARRITVRDLKTDEIATSSSFDSGIRKVTVTVSRFGKDLTRLRSIRTRSWKLSRTFK